MLNLSIPPVLLAALANAGWVYGEGKDTVVLRGIMLYILDQCFLLRNPDNEDKSIDHDDYWIARCGIDLTEISAIADWYAPHLLNELVLSNITNPYLVDVYSHSFTVANKEEYR